MLAAARLAPGSEFWPDRLSRRGPGCSPPTAGGAGTRRRSPRRPSRPGATRWWCGWTSSRASRRGSTAVRFEGQLGLSRRATRRGLRSPRRRHPRPDAARPRRRGGAHALPRDAPRPGPGRVAAGHARADRRGGERPRSTPGRGSPSASRATAATRPRGSEGRWTSIRPRRWTARSWSARRAGWRPSTGTAGFATPGSSHARCRAPTATRAVVVFHVTEGRQVLVRTVQFDGRAGLPEEDLRTILERGHPGSHAGGRGPATGVGSAPARDPAGHRRPPRHPGPSALVGLRRGGVARRGRGDAARVPRARLGGREGHPGDCERGRARVRDGRALPPRRGSPDLRPLGAFPGPATRPPSSRAAHAPARCALQPDAAGGGRSPTPSGTSGARAISSRR